MALQRVGTTSLALLLVLGPVACGGRRSSTAASSGASTVSVSGVGLDRSSLVLSVGGSSASLNATLAPSGATNPGVSWTTGNSAVATVLGGVVSPVGAGTTLITVTTADGAFSASCQVTVTVPVTGVTLDQITLSLPLGGGSVTLNATVAPSGATNPGVSWTTGNSAVATVVGGVLSPVGAGTTLITVITADGAKTATCAVTVYVPVTSVGLDKSSLSLTAGLAVGTLTATVLPANASYPQLTWASSSPAVASVSGGVVTPLAEGVTTITASSADGLQVASCPVTVVASTGPQLLAIGTLDGATDLSGLTGTLENGNPAAMLGGMGSGLAWAGGYTFLALPDRGPNATVYDASVDNTTSYISRFHTLQMGLSANTSGSGLPYTLSPTLVDTTLLSSPTALSYGSSLAQALVDVQTLNAAQGIFYFVGRSDCYGTGGSGLTTHARLDPEAIRVANDGQSVFISDEYGPYVYQFDRHTGQRLNAFTLPSTFYVSTLSPMGATEISSNTTGRVANKGMEGLAITPDGKTLVGFMQSPLAQDGGDGGRCNRIVTIDIATGTTHEYVYDNRISTTAKNYNSSELLAVNDHVFLVLERDGKGMGDGSSAVIKRLYKIDISGATDVASLSGESVLLPYAVAKTLFLDIQQALVNCGLASTAIPAKIEGAAFGPDITVDGIVKHTLWIGNDNDFIRDTAGANKVFLFAVSDADLGGSTYVAQQVQEDATASLAVMGLSLSPTVLALNTGGSAGSLTPVVLPAKASNKALTWSSSNSAVATVVGGLVSPVATGTATITATTVDGSYTASSVVTVTAPVVSVTGLTLDPSTLSFTLGDAAKSLIATVSPSNATTRTVSWASSNPSVATVSGGSVSAVGAGNATLTATSTDGGYTATCSVTVFAATVSVNAISLNASALTLSGTKTLVATVLPSNASDLSVSWGSSDSSVASVSGGVVSAVGMGSATITATTTDGGHLASCNVTVAPFYGFDATGLTYAKYGLAGGWASEGSPSPATLALVVSQDGTTFYGAVNVSGSNGNIYQKVGPAGPWTQVVSSTASGTMKALAFDGSNFFGFTATGKFNTTTQGGTWAASNVGGTSGLALVSVVYDGGTLYGFTASGALYTNTLANVSSTNTWTQISPNVAPLTLASVTWDGSSFYGISSTGSLCTKSGALGVWTLVDSSGTAASLVALTCQ